jgi:hypothetical protein
VSRSEALEIDLIERMAVSSVDCEFEHLQTAHLQRMAAMPNATAAIVDYAHGRLWAVFNDDFSEPAKVFAASKSIR